MKKSTLLSLATVGTIVATSIGTFAAWDVTEATSNGTLGTVNRVVVTSDADSVSYTATRTLNDVPVYTGSASYDLTTAKGVVEDGKAQLDLAVVVKADGEIINTGYTLSVKRQGASSDLTLTSGKYTDSAATLDANNKYDITVTLMDDADGQKLVGKALTVEVTGTLSEKTA